MSDFYNEITDRTAFFNACNHALQDLNIQTRALQNQRQSGIISAVDATQEMAMIKAKELKIKKQLVNVVHVKSNGMPRSIAHHGPTNSYPKGYVYTKLEGGKLIKAKDLDSLYSRLYDMYFGQEDCTFSIVSIFEKALEEKQATENPKDGTIRRYRYECKKYFTDDFLEKDIRELSELDIKVYTQELVNTRKITKKQYLAYKSVLNLIYSYAFNHRIITENPVLKIKNAVYLKSCDCSKATTDEKILSQDEIQSLIDDAAERAAKHYYIMYYAMRFSVYTGCRVGEICALKREDIDFENGLVHIHSQQLSLDKDGRCQYYMVNYTKNERGVSNGGRYFPLTDDIRSLLEELYELQKSKNIRSEFVFCYPDGSWITTRGYSCFLRKLCRRHGLKVTNNHAFRMSLNSNIMIPNGLPAIERAKLLGHSVETNLKYYSYAPKDYLENARNILNQASVSLREPFSEQKEPFSSIPFRQKKSPQTLNL